MPSSGQSVPPSVSAGAAPGNLWCTPTRGLAFPSSRWWVLGWVLPLAVQLVHTVVVAPTYHVGSFDDDANYLLAAHVLASGGGLTTTMPSGAAVVANYLPGYPLLLVPLIWVWGDALWPPRAFSVVCIAVLYPLLWAWMARRGVKPPNRVAVLGLLAMNQVIATYSTMVMAEAPFLVVLILTLFAIDRWERQPGWRWAAVVAVLLAELVWLKEAGIGMAAGVVLYQLWRRRWRAAAGVGTGVVALLLPGLVSRWVTGGATVGDRYAGEISDPSQGGLIHHLPTEVVNDIWAYAQSVLRQSVLPSGSPLSPTGPVHALVAVIGVSVPIFCVVGSISWYRHHPGAESWMVWAYFAETLAYPYTNQRRVLLILPVVTAWYVVGAAVAGRWVLAVSRRTLSRAVVGIAVAAAVLAAGVPTASGFAKNYAFRLGEQSSEFARSPAMSLLKAIGPPSAVVETDYRGSVAYFTGHRTQWTAFTETTLAGPSGPANVNNCTPKIVRTALRADDAKFLVVGDFSDPGLLDSPCLFTMGKTTSKALAIGAVGLLSTSHDDTSLFELLGPGSSQPNLVDRTARLAPSAGSAAVVVLKPNGSDDAGGIAYSSPAVGGEANFVWMWSGAVALSQVSVASVTSSAPISSARVAIELPGGTWRTVASANGPVGDGGAAPYLLAQFAAGTRAVGIRVSARTIGRAEVGYVNAIGPAH